MLPVTRHASPVAVDPRYVAVKTEKLKVMKEPLAPNWDVLFENGTRLFIIEGEEMSLSHRRNVMDSNSQKMYQIRRQVIWLFGDDNTYYAEATENGPRLWEMKSKKHFSGTEITMSFANHANGGIPDQLNFKDPTEGSTGYVTYHGQTVGAIHRNKH